MTVVVAPERPSLLGPALIAGGMTFVGFIDNLVRVVSDSMHVWQFHLLRSAAALALILAWLAARGALGRLGARRPWAVALRSAVMTTSMMLYYSALPVLPIAQVAAGMFTSPLWILAVSALFLGERVGPRRVLAILAGFTGALLILQPDAEGLNLAALMPLGGGALYGMTILLTRRLCAEETTETIVVGGFLGYGAAGALGSAALALWPAPPGLVALAPFVFAPWGALDATLILWIGFFALGAAAALAVVTRGYQITESASAALYDYAFIVSAGLFGWILWGQTLDALALAGVALVMAAGGFLALAPGRRPAGAAR
ncbi:MAG: DMT family transporter [Rhodobacteraceae bacterium]|nr:MAG: DMT family transporter [Paracoccaceae bacterium]